MSEKVECVADGANQSLRVGDWVAGVRIEPRVHTLVGRVKRLTPTTAVIAVTWVSEPDPSLSGLALRQRAQVGGDTRVGLARVFRLAIAVTEPSDEPNPSLQRATERARELIARAGEARTGTGTGTEMETGSLVDAYREAIQTLQATRDELAAANGEVTRLKELVRGDGLTDDGNSVLNRHATQLRYASALDRAIPGYVEGQEEVRSVAWGLAEVVLRVRDRELGMLRQRLSLDAESLLETDSTPETAAVERGVDQKRARQLLRLVELPEDGTSWMDTLMAVVKLKVTAARVNSAEREAATLREWTRVARYAVGANVEPDKLEALADWLDQLDRLRAVPGARPSDEIQRDLRTWAALMRRSACDEITRLSQEMEVEAAEVTRKLGEVDRGCGG